MPPAVIDNPILNSPFAEPARHFRFDDDGITNEIAEGRRRSTYFIPIPKPKVKGGGQIALAGDFATEQARDNDFINRVREHVGAWRNARYPGITAVTRELLTYWQDPAREKPLFFCQIEALETAIFLAEVAGHPNGRTLIVAHSGDGALYTVDPVTGASAQIAGADVPSVDGIIFEAGRLWAVQNFANQIVELRLSSDLSSATVERIITSDEFQIPTTVARAGGRLAVVNAKFDTGFPPTASSFEVVIVDGR